MGDQCHIYLFGDQSYDYARELRDLVRSSPDPLLTAFCEKVYYVLRAEIGNLPQHQRQNFKRFANFPELAALSQAGRLHPSLDQALFCAYLLASFIREHSSDRSYPKAASSYVSGLCTGALAAAAICSSTSVSNLLPAAIHCVVVAFRVGQCSLEVGRTICPQSGDHMGSWSIFCPATTAKDASQAIENFLVAKHLSITSRPYLSAISDHGATISGPPSVLLDMQKDTSLAKIKTIPLPLSSPYHAEHLFSENDIDSILSTTSSERLASQRPALQPISSATGEFVWASNFRSMLRVAVEDILVKPLRWDQLIRRLASAVASIKGVPVIMHATAVSADRAARTITQQSGCDTPISVDHSRSLRPVGFFEPYASSGNLLGSGSSGRPDKSKIAVIGASGRIPGAEDLAAFWDLLYEGRDVHKVVPPLHWDAKTHVDSTGKSKNTSATPFGCWLDHPELFDAKFFNISPREAPQIDPAQRLALMTAYEAIEQAGIVSDTTSSTQKDRVGVFYGVTSNDWMETNSAQKIDTYFIPGGNRAFIPGRINYFFKFSGPSFSVDTACSSSLAAIHTACNALWRGEIDTAIAGGTNVLTNPDFTAGLDRGHFLSRTGNCKTFDDDADGYCRGEGVATVILKRVEDAIADGDPIQAIISGACTNHSAEAESITRPHAAAQIDIFRKVLNSAGVEPYDISYVEMHGTGTQAGDGAEMRSVLETFAPETGTRRNGDQALYVGSAKANVGHGEAASGAVSLTKLLLMLNHNIIPPHCGIKSKINHTFPTDLKERRVFIANEPTPWKRPNNGVRKAFLNNFSAAGGNTALLIEDAPVRTMIESNDRRSNHVVAVSARCAASLEGNISAILSFLDNMQPKELPYLAWTTTARRMHHPHRVMVYGDDTTKVKARLLKALKAKEGSTRPKSAAKIVFAFTGQGAAYRGMAEKLYEEISSFRSHIDRLDQTARNLGFPSFKTFLTTSNKDISEPSPLVSQLAITCLEIALGQLWKSWGIHPYLVIGHSLGEYAALNAAGVLSESDTIYLVGKRAQLLQQHCLPGTHSMLAIKARLADVQSALSGRSYEIACINGPEDVVICGNSEEIYNAQQLLASSGTKASVLQIPYAFHSAQVDPILPNLKEVAESVTFHAPAIPVSSPLHASTINEKGVFGPEYISRHCRETVNIQGAVVAAQEGGTLKEKSMVVEIGPQPVVSAMIKAIAPETQSLPSLRRNTDTWEVITQTISSLYTAGADILWREHHRDFKSSHKVLQLPAYRWDLKEYWTQYVNDWSLRKGDPPLVQDVPSHKVEVPAPKAPRLESTTIHSLVKENLDASPGSLIVESDISRPDLNPMVQGHKVNGVPLCTPSVYADIALSLGDYLRNRHFLDKKERGVVVSEMVIDKALIAAPRGPQILRTTVDIDQNKKSAMCRFTTVQISGKKLEHAHCSIRFQDSSKLRDLQSQVPSIQRRMENMRKGLETGDTYKFNKPMIYKMVSTLAQFDPNYRAMEEIVLDSSAMEASSVANFSAIKAEGAFHTNPAYIDALSQSAGFVMNANDRANLEVEVFVNHGWSSFQLFEALSPHKSYQAHVAMSERPGKMWTGDILVLDEDKVVATFGGIALQGVARRLLHYILSTESVAQTGAGDPKDASKVAKSAQKTTTQPPRVDVKPSKSPEVLKNSTTQPSKVTQESVKVASAKPAIPSSATISEAKKIIPAATAKPVGVSKETAKIILKAIQIISEESGIANEELTDSTVLADVGIDSLLSLMITSRFRDELSLDVDSAIFHDVDNIKELKDSLIRSQGGVATAETTEAELVQVPQVSQDYEDPDEQSTVSKDYISIEKEEPTSISHQDLSAQASESSVSGIFPKVLEIISEETGIALAEITDDTVFADAGIDSLLSLMITSRLRDELDLQTDADAALFNTCSTVKELKAYLVPVDDTQQDSPLVISSSTSNDSLARGGEATAINSESDTSEGSGDEDYIEILSTSSPSRRATSLILQGRPWVATKTLFLFPDGAGSASSYANLPKIHSDLAVIGLNCPYVRHPQEMTCPLDDLMRSYLDELKRRQPKGPYSVGGWSAGGILAYRAAQLLIHEGEEVESLILIDSPVPKGLDKLPQRFYDHCKSIGMFGKMMPGSSPSPPSQLFAHFDATIEVLHNYYAEPLPPGRLGKATIMWATECVMDGVKFAKLPPGPDDTEGMRFLSEQRTDFTGAGWEKLFPGTAIDIQRAKGAHHFAILQEPQAQHSSKTIRSAVGL